VFSEVAGDGAYYFTGNTAADLADALRSWLALHAAGAHPRPSDIAWATWQDCAARLLDLVTAEPASARGAPDIEQVSPMRAAAE
jgi:hypothetical protein